jgi:hypothetical protein
MNKNDITPEETRPVTRYTYIRAESDRQFGLVSQKGGGGYRNRNRIPAIHRLIDNSSIIEPVCHRYV